MMRVPAVVAVLLCADLAAAAAIESIRHEPVSCIPEGKYVTVTAAGVPADEVASATLQFRKDASEPGWYSIRMLQGAGSWVGVLPRPMKEIGKFDYRVVMTTKDLQNKFTPPFSARVVADGTCATPAQNEAASIVVEVPPGAPVMPPVPPGFSPAGVVAAAEPKAPDRRSKVKWAGGAIAAAAVGALVAGVGPGTPDPPPFPEVTIQSINGTNETPGQGVTYSASRSRLSAVVSVQGEPLEPITFTWFFTLHAGIREACLTMTDTMTLSSTRPLTLVLTAPVLTNGFCGPSFDINFTKLTIVVDGQVARTTQTSHNFRVVP